jgi:hypothetical protein
MEKHVCSLEMSKKLKEAGFRQDTMFYHGIGREGKNIFRGPSMEGFGATKICAAPLATELLEELPESVSKDKDGDIDDMDYFLRVQSNSRGWNVAYVTYGDAFSETANNLCDALAAMWLKTRSNP